MQHQSGPGRRASPPLRIVEVIGMLSERFGGPQRYVREISPRLCELGHAVTLIGTDVGERGLDAADIQLGDVDVHVARGSTGFAIAPGATRAIARLVRQADVVHVHGMYTYPGSVAAKCAWLQRTPYIISPHGAANDFHFAVRRWKKAPFETLLQRPEMRRADAVLVLSELERRHAERNFGLDNVLVVPPSISLPETPGRAAVEGLYADHPEMRGKLLVTFMARFSEKKGAPLLVDAFRSVAAKVPEAHLVMAGPDDEGSIGRTVESGLRGTHLAGRVTFPGMVSGESKAALLSESDVFVLPSADESFGIAVAEAMAAAVPVVVTPEVALSEEVSDADAGRVVPRSPEGIAEGILGLLRAADRAAIGARGRALVGERFASATVIGELESVYRHAVARDRPET